MALTTYEYPFQSAFSVIDALLSTLSPVSSAAASPSAASAPSELFGSTVGAADCVAFPEANLMQVSADVDDAGAESHRHKTLL